LMPVLRSILSAVVLSGSQLYPVKHLILPR
jgi:hypothetical protein